MGGPAIIDGEAVASTDNFYVAPFILDGFEWPTAEHYYQAAKFLSDDGDMCPHVEEIRKAETGAKAWSLAQRHSANIRADWEYIKVNVMYRAVAAKYSAHPTLAAEFASTQGPILTPVSTPDWKYLNALILERVREELRPQGERNEKRYSALVSLTEPRLQGKAAMEKLRTYVPKATELTGKRTGAK